MGDTPPEPHSGGKDKAQIHAFITQNILTKLPNFPSDLMQEMTSKERLTKLLENRERQTKRVKMQVISSALQEQDQQTDGAQKQNPLIGSDFQKPSNFDAITQQYTDASVARTYEISEKGPLLSAPTKPGAKYKSPLEIEQLAPLSQEVKVVKALELLSDSMPERRRYWDKARQVVGIGPLRDVSLSEDPDAVQIKPYSSSAKRRRRPSGSASPPRKSAAGSPLSAAGSERPTGKASLPPKPVP